MDLQGIKQRFGIIGNNEALDRALDIAVQVAPTDISVLVIGESGAGKTTLVALLLRTYNVPDGTVFLDGKDINEIPIVEIAVAIRRIVAGQVGITREDLFHFTALRFGITRAGTNVDLRCSEALDILLRQKLVGENERMITLL